MSSTYLYWVSVTFQDPELDIDSATLNAWYLGRLMNAEALLSAAIPTSKNKACRVLGSRALVRARLGRWDAALVDAEEVRVATLHVTRALTPLKIKSIRIQRSLVGYVAKCLAFVGKGEKDKGFHLCDIAMMHFRSKHVTLLLLIKVRDSAQPQFSFDLFPSDCHSFYVRRTRQCDIAYG